MFQNERLRSSDCGNIDMPARSFACTERERRAQDDVDELSREHDVLEGEFVNKIIYISEQIFLSN